MNNMVNPQDKSGDVGWIVDEDEETEFWMKDLDELQRMQMSPQIDELKDNIWDSKESG